PHGRAGAAAGRAVGGTGETGGESPMTSGTGRRRWRESAPVDGRSRETGQPPSTGGQPWRLKQMSLDFLEALSEQVGHALMPRATPTGRRQSLATVILPQ